MQNQRIGLRYAESLLSLANETNVSDAVLEDMKIISATINENTELTELLKNPIVKSDKKQNILNAIFSTNKSPLTASLINILCDKGRENVLASVAEQFVVLYKQEKKLITATVTTAFKLDDETKKQVVSIVNQKVEGTVELVEKVDENIIGGFILQIGDQRINNSIANKLASLEREFESKTLI